MPALFLLDVNECTKSSDGCEQICTNTVGSFECSCDSGFVLDDNHLSCNGKSLYFGLLHICCFFERKLSHFLIECLYNNGE